MIFVYFLFRRENKALERERRLHWKHKRSDNYHLVLLAHAACCFELAVSLLVRPQIPPACFHQLTSHVTIVKSVRLLLPQPPCPLLRWIACPFHVAAPGMAVGTWLGALNLTQSGSGLITSTPS